MGVTPILAGWLFHDSLVWLGPIGVAVWALTASARRIAIGVAAWASVILVVSTVGVLSRGAPPLSAWLLLLVDGIAAASAWDSVAWRRESPRWPARTFYGLWALFWLALAGAAVSSNLGTAWVAIELSTLASGALIALGSTPRAFEAAWKYVVIASIGMGLGLIGLIVLYGGMTDLHVLGWHALSYGVLSRWAPHIPVVARQVATLLLVVGFGTKAGLAPFHTWLPDAHAEAPGPVSGLLSGVLLALALVTIVRVVHAVPLPSTVGVNGPHLLMGLGLLSVAIGGGALFHQRDLKRLLAYSSIEQVGIMAVGFGLATPLGTAGALWQLVLHALVKSALFFLAGHLVARFGTHQLRALRGFGGDPAGRTLLALGLLSIAGVPPFGIAFSEWIILEAAWTARLAWVAVALGALMFMAFVALLHHLIEVVWGNAGPVRLATRTGITPRGRGAGVSAGLLAMAIMVGGLGWLAIPPASHATVTAPRGER